MPRCLAIILLGLLLLMSTGCKRRPVPQVPPPPLSPPAAEPVEEPAPEPLPDPPVIEPLAQEDPALLPSAELPPAPPPDAEAPPETPLEPAPGPVPSLAPMLTPEQHRLYQRELAAALARTQRCLGILAQRSLTADQEILYNRVRTFVHQAEAMRSTDLATANGLARRAELLAQELMDSTK